MIINNLFYIITTVWLATISGVLIWFVLRLNAIIKGSDGKGLLRTLDNITKIEKENKEVLDKLIKDLAKLAEDGHLHIQKVGLVRFNPFNETGGDHSFSLALLDGKDQGFVITGLHTRERTRLYVKPVNNLKSEYELSNEEKKALEKASKKR
jgi:hypothetical protein